MSDAMTASTAAPEGSFLATGRGKVTLALLCLATFLDVMDGAIVNVAMPTIRAHLGFSVQNLQWVISGYLITYGGFLLLGGRAGDLLGRRRLLIAGTALFAASSLACGLAGSQGLLVGARLAQGFGAAMMSPAALSILTTTFQDSDRHKALGVWATRNDAAYLINLLDDQDGRVRESAMGALAKVKENWSRSCHPVSRSARASTAWSPWSKTAPHLSSQRRWQPSRRRCSSTPRRAGTGSLSRATGSRSTSKSAPITMLWSMNCTYPACRDRASPSSCGLWRSATPTTRRCCASLSWIRSSDGSAQIGCATWGVSTAGWNCTDRRDPWQSLPVR